MEEFQNLIEKSQKWANAIPITYIYKTTIFLSLPLACQKKEASFMHPNLSR
jgi:hypothetical protein